MSTSIESMLTHRDWVRRVARALVSSEAEAEEIEQEAWVRAVTRPPESEGKVRAWFRTVLKRLARDRWRTETRRDAREARSPRPPETSPTADLVAEAESHRLVVNAALALPEPYREAIVLRFFHELPATEIAERLDIPLETVRTRVKRALARLRKDLDDRHGGDRRAWTAVVALLLPTSAKAGMLLTTKLALVTTAAAILATVIAVWPAPETPDPVETVAEVPTEAEPEGVFETAVEPEIEPAAPPPADPAAGEETGGPNLVAPPPPAPEPTPAAVVRIVDHRGRAVAGAKVSVHPMRPRPELMGWIYENARTRAVLPPLPAVFQGTTDKNGEVGIPTAPEGHAQVHVTAEGFAPFADYTNFARPGSETFVLVPGTELSGVVRRRDGTVVPGVAVTSDRNDPRVRCVTDEDGRYRLSGLRSGRDALLLHLPSGLVVASETIDTRRIRTYDFVLDLDASVRGRVLDDATGRGIAGARVRVSTSAQNAEGLSCAATTTSAEDGSFAFDGLPRGRLHVLDARAEGYLPLDRDYHPNQEPLRPGRACRQDLRLRRGAIVAGEVRFDSGEPAPGVRVRLFIQDCPQDFETHADARGRFRFDAVATGAGKFYVQGPGLYYPDGDRGWRYHEAPEHMRIFVPESGEVRKTLRAARGATAEGVVMDPDGTPRPGIRVFSRPFGGEHVTTDEYGRFRIAGLPPGDAVRIHETSMGAGYGVSEPLRVYGTETIRGIVITAGSEDLAGVAGTVRGSGASLPEDLQLGVASGGERGRWEHARPVPVAMDGTFRIEDLRPGHHTLLVTAGGFGEIAVPVMDLTAGEMREGLDLRLSRERRISGRVTRKDGDSTAGTPIHLVRWGDREEKYGSGDIGVVRTFAGETGRFTIEGLAPGPYRVTAAIPGMMDTAVLAEAGAEDVLIEATRARRITGLLIDAGTKKPAADVTIVARPSARVRVQPQRTARTRTGPDGRFVLDSLYALPYELDIADVRHARPEDPEYVRQERTVLAGKTNLRIYVVPGRTIEGRVLGGDRKPLGGISVDSLRSRHCVWTGHDGTFRLPRLNPGRHELRISARGTRDLVTVRKKGVVAGTRDLLIVMETGPSISGRILNPDGSPPTGRRGHLSVMRTGAKRGDPVGVAADGTFETRPLKADGVYDLVAKGFDDTIGVRVRRVLAGTEGVRLRLRTGGTIAGRVIDENGNPAPAGLYVAAYAIEHRESLTPQGNRPWTRTQADGTFILRGVGEFTFSVRASGSGSGGFTGMRTDGENEVRVGATGVVLRVCRTVGFAGRLVDRQGRAVCCTLEHWQKDGYGKVGSRGRTTAEGRFAYSSVRPGKIQLIAFVDGKKIDLGEFVAPAEDVVVTVD